MKRLKTYPWIGISLLLLTIIASSMVADSVKDVLNKIIPSSNNIIMLILSLAIFMGAFLLLYHYRKSFLGVRTLQQVKTRPLEGLILLLSTPNHVPETFSFPITIKDRNGNEATIKGHSLDDDIEELNRVKWNWQQILRGLKNSSGKA